MKSGNGNGSRAGSPLESVVDGVAGLGGDILALAELQGQLAVADLKETRSLAMIPLIVLGAGLVVLLSCVPVLLIGLGYVIAESTSLSNGQALLATAGVALVVAGVASYLAFSRLAGSFGSFRRSRDELTRNLSWIRTVLLHSGRSTPPRRVT